MLKALPLSRVYYGWFVVFSSFLIFLAVSGTRGSFGNFILPLSREFGWSIQQVSLAASLGTFFYGIAQPFIGFLVNRHGPRVAILSGTLIYGSLTMLLATLTQLWQLYLIYGLFMGISWGATSNTSNASLISRWFVKRKGLALAFAISGMAMGNFLVIPFSMFLILNIGWQRTFVAMGLLVLIIAFPVALKIMRNSPQEKGLLPDGEILPSRPASGLAKIEKTASPAAVKRMGLPQAVRTRPFWHLLGAYFVCGFSALMSSTFFVPMAMSSGFPAMDAARAAGLMGGMAALGLWLGGFLSDSLGRKGPLAAFYFLRAVGLIILLFIAMLKVNSLPVLYLAAAFIGFGSFGTAPITAGLVGDIYGVLSMGTIFGVISMAHQLGGAFSIYMTGVMVDLTQSYQLPITAAILLLFGASTASLLIPEKKKV